MEVERNNGSLPCFSLIQHVAARTWCVLRHPRRSPDRLLTSERYASVPVWRGGCAPTYPSVVIGTSATCRLGYTTIRQ